MQDEAASKEEPPANGNFSTFSFLCDAVVSLLCCLLHLTVVNMYSAPAVVSLQPNVCTCCNRCPSTEIKWSGTIFSTDINRQCTEIRFPTVLL